MAHAYWNVLAPPRVHLREGGGSRSLWLGPRSRQPCNSDKTIRVSRLETVHQGGNAGLYVVMRRAQHKDCRDKGCESQQKQRWAMTKIHSGGGGQCQFRFGGSVSVSVSMKQNFLRSGVQFRFR